MGGIKKRYNKGITGVLKGIENGKYIIEDATGTVKCKGKNGIFLHPKNWRIEKIEPSVDTQVLNKWLDQEEGVEQEEVDQEKEEDNDCAVCMDSEKTHVLVPCGHRCVCQACGDELNATDDLRKCPMCREPFTH